MQRFANPKAFVVLLTLFSFSQSMLISGLNRRYHCEQRKYSIFLSLGFFPNSITSIQLQFGLSSTQMGALAGVYDGTVAIAALVLTHYAHRAHTPRWLARAMMTFAVGCVLFLLPLVVGPRYHPGNAAVSELCDGTADQVDCQNHESHMYILFLLGMLVLGLGSTPIYTIGLTYLDDNISPEYLSLTLGVFYSANAVGPAIGYLLGGAMLDVYVYPSSEPDRLTPVSEGWVGAWWVGFTLSLAICTVVCTLFYLVPRHMPGTSWIRALHNKHTTTSGRLGFFESVKRLASNPTWVAVATGNFCDVGTYLCNVHPSVVILTLLCALSL
jgi:MFS family permease